jgi:hypothetical protein
MLSEFWKSPEQGATTIVWVAVARELQAAGGKYLDNQITGLVDPKARHAPGYAPWPYDLEREVKLWKMTLKLLDLEE